MQIQLTDFLEGFKPKVCSFAYILNEVTPVVCQMGYVINENKIILHTNTWTKKWNAIKNGQNVALCMGFNHLANYVQLQGTIQKIHIEESIFEKLESIYFREHVDSVYYKKNNQQGIFLITPIKLHYATVIDRNVSFKDYSFI